MTILHRLDPATGQYVPYCSAEGTPRQAPSETTTPPVAATANPTRAEVEAARLTPAQRKRLMKDGAEVLARAAKNVAQIADRYDVTTDEVIAKAETSVRLCADNGKSITVVSPIVFVEGISREAYQREMAPIDSAFTLYVASGCP